MPRVLWKYNRIANYIHGDLTYVPINLICDHVMFSDLAAVSLVDN